MRSSASSIQIERGYCETDRPGFRRPADRGLGGHGRHTTRVLRRRGETPVRRDRRPDDAASLGRPQRRRLPDRGAGELERSPGHVGARLSRHRSRADGRQPSAARVPDRQRLRVGGIELQQERLRPCDGRPEHPRPGRTVQREVRQARTGRTSRGLRWAVTSPAVVAEQWPRSYDGAMPICGVLGDYELFDYFLDFNVGAQALSGVGNSSPSRRTT